MNTKTLIKELTIISLSFYIFTLIVFETRFGYTFLSTIGLYQYLLIGSISVLYKNKFKITYYNIAMLLLDLYLITFILFNPSTGSSLTLYRILTTTVITLLVVNSVDSKKDIEKIIQVYFFSGSILGVFILTRYGLSLFNIVTLNTVLIDIGFEFGNVNQIGFYTGMSFLISLFIILKNEKRFVNNFMIIFLGSLSLTVSLITGSKKSLILIMLGLFLLFILKENKSRNIISRISRIVMGTVVIVLIMIMINNLNSFSYLAERLNNLFYMLIGKGGTISDEFRLLMIRNGLSEFMKNPLFGYGINYSTLLFGTYSHNNFIELLMNTGLIGFSIYYFVYLTPIVILVKDWKRLGDYSIIFLVIIIILLVSEIAMVTYYDRYIQILLSVLSVYVYIKSKRYNNIYDEQ